MEDPLAASALLQHVRALADTIGPRPAGSLAEAQAREYIRRVLGEAGLGPLEEQPFPAWETWGYSMIVPAALALSGNALGVFGRLGRLAGGLLALACAYHLDRTAVGARQPLSFLFPKRGTANLLARIPATGQRRHIAVLIGHTDSNKQRASFAPARKHMLRASTTAGIAAVLLNGIAQLIGALGIHDLARPLQRVSALAMAATLPVLLLDEQDGFVDGANDNASAVACLLGLGAQLQQHPLANTEVWLAFTGAEEVGDLGTHELLDRCGATLADAWFIDFELVGAPEVAYVTRHKTLSLRTYAPDAGSLALAEAARAAHPELGVGGRAVTITEEVGSLRGRGFRGICLVGLGPDGWLPEWHRFSDDTAHLDPSGLERAARFALAMLEILDRSPA